MARIELDEGLAHRLDALVRQRGWSLNGLVDVLLTIGVMFEPINKSMLTGLMRVGRERLEAVLHGLDEARMTVPDLPNGWSVRDLLAHLAYWERRAYDLLAALRRGETPAGFENSQTDAINAQVYAEAQSRTLEESRRAEREAFDLLLAEVEASAEVELFQPGHFPNWAGGTPFVGWVIGNSYGHYGEHMQALLDLAGKPGAVASPNDILSD